MVPTRTRVVQSSLSAQGLVAIALDCLEHSEGMLRCMTWIGVVVDPGSKQSWGCRLVETVLCSLVSMCGGVTPRAVTPIFVQAVKKHFRVGG